MRRGNPVARWVGIGFILLWSLIPIYWAVNTSLQRDVDAGARPANYVPPHPTLHNYGLVARTIPVWHFAANSCRIATPSDVFAFTPKPSLLRWTRIAVAVHKSASPSIA